MRRRETASSTVTGSEVAYVAGARWAEAAETLFNEALLGAFNAGPGPARLVIRGEPARADYTLRLDVQRFEAVYDRGARAAPEVRVEVHMVLIRASDRVLVKDETLAVQTRAEANRVSAIVQAFDKAVGEVLTKIVSNTNAGAVQAASPAIRLAAVTVLTSRQATVMGPTPPGTGVMALATSRAALSSTSPTSLVLPSAALTGSRKGTGLVPTSITDDAGLEPLSLDHLGPAGGRHQYVRLPTDRRQILRLRMGDGHGAVGMGQQLGDRAADQGRASHHHSALARQIRAQGVADQDHAANRRARRQAGQALSQPPGIDDVQAVHILVRINGLDDGLLVEPLWKGQLDQNAVYGRVAVQMADKGQEFSLGGVGRQDVGHRMHARGPGLLTLGPDIDLAGPVIPHQHHRQPRCQAMIGLEAGDFGGHICPQALGCSPAVNDAGLRHGS